MERRKFLESIGIGAAFAITATCLGSCKKDAVTPTGTVDFTLDLLSADNLKLNTFGGYIIKNQVVVARTKDGNYAAATVICSHEGRQQIVYDVANNEYNCTAHQARFDLNGKGLNGNGSNGLTIYKTTLTGTNLRVYS